MERCAPTGREWLPDSCGNNSVCIVCNEGDPCTEDYCQGPCDTTDLPSSAGCSFVANRQLHPYGEFPDGLVITNPSRDLEAWVEIYEVPAGLLKEELLEAFPLEPGESHIQELLTDFVPGTSSNFRTGGIFRVYSDTPVIAYHHAPLVANRGNESALLLPDNVLGTDYIAISYPGARFATLSGMPSYFELVAIENNTRVEWTPRVATAGDGLPIPHVPAGQTGVVMMNRYDTLRIVPSTNDLSPDEPDGNLELDISGTIIHSNNPVWVTGATRNARIPVGNGGTGDPLQENLFPLQHWGKEYVALAAVTRGLEDEAENTYWRVFAGTDGVEVTSTPSHPAFPLQLPKKGDFVEFETDPGVSLVLSGNRAFLPVQYIRSRNPDPNEFPNLPYGDPSMVQMVPTQQFLTRYVFSTGVGFFYNDVQFTRQSGSADVLLNGTAVENWQQIGEYDIATLSIESGTHVAESDSPFGIIQSGHALGEADDPYCNVPPDIFCNSSYSYPGGMRAEAIFVP